MFDKLISIIAPHYCCGCDKIGALLCVDCKNNIIDERERFCIACCAPTSVMSLCGNCNVLYEKAWAVGFRDGVLQRVIGDYKFQRMLGAYKDLGDLLLGTIPDLPNNTIIVPIPTATNHIRERGYDHMLVIAKYFAKERGLSCQKLISRKTNTKQRQSNADKREEQAKHAFKINADVIDKDVPYLVLDDVMTTGATIKYACKLLKQSGAKHIWVALIARQK